MDKMDLLPFNISRALGTHNVCFCIVHVYCATPSTRPRAVIFSGAKMSI